MTKRYTTTKSFSKGTFINEVKHQSQKTCQIWLEITFAEILWDHLFTACAKFSKNIVPYVHKVLETFFRKIFRKY